MKHHSVIVGFIFLSFLFAANAVAESACTTCHGDKVADFAGKVHGGADSTCTVCHGDGSAHIGAPGTPGSILTFRSEPATAKSAPCQGCHKQTHSPTTANTHDQAGLTCADCHSIHQPDARPAMPAGFENASRASTTCFACHEDTFAQFALSERHRLAEGSVSCTSCHDPHGPDSRRHLAGFKQSQCAKCHMDAAGPFVFEHAASRVEGCLACHVPHGSPNRHLLTHQQVGELCYGCHATVPQFHLGFSPVGAPRFEENTVCTNCHVTIHGSNLDKDFLR